MSEIISNSKIAQVSYIVFDRDAEEVVEDKTTHECRMNCRRCKNIGVCDFGLFANSL